VGDNDFKCMLEPGGRLAFAQDSGDLLPNRDNSCAYCPCWVSCRWQILRYAGPACRRCQGAGDPLYELTVGWLPAASAVEAFAQEQEGLRASLAHVVAEVNARCLAGDPRQPQLITVPRRFAESHQQSPQPVGDGAGKRTTVCCQGDVQRSVDQGLLPGRGAYRHDATVLDLATPGRALLARGPSGGRSFEYLP
jgi:hypothetical protein